MPIHDPQFWMVSLAAVWGGVILLRQFFPRATPEGSACGSCALGAAACRKHETIASAGLASSHQSVAGSKLVVLRDS